LVGGFLSYFWYFNINPGDSQSVLKAIFIGVILTATSVSITVEALRELGHLTGKVGNAILGAAIVDDVIGIIILTVITSFRDSSISISIVLIKIVLYFVIMLVFGLIITAGARMLDLKTDRRQITVYVFALVLIVAYISEKYVGIADITGAYLIGMIFSKFSIRNEIVKKMNVLSYLFFSPIFFASVGLKTKLDSFSTSMIVFSVIILLVAIFTKIIGAGIGAKLCKYSLKDSLNIGIGMVSRGEVALIVAQKGHKLGFIDNNMFSPIVLMVVITTILTPILLKISMPKTKEDKDVSLKPMTIE
ncbi:cation:proton antiporter, partial [Peptostreptococcus porci]